MLCALLVVVGGWRLSTIVVWSVVILVIVGVEVGSVEFLSAAGGDKLVLPRGDLRLVVKTGVTGIFFVIVWSILESKGYEKRESICSQYRIISIFVRYI